ncbi:MAG: ATP-binding protein [Bacteriovorax sp.]|nr:ATP-binding protein [Bacteriovorax sp.]
MTYNTSSMWIQRDIFEYLEHDSGIFIQILIGPRQCGKSSLLTRIGENKFQDIDFDDLQIRTLAQNDPALFLSQHPAPLNLDEVQYVPNLFPQLKLQIDRIKKENLFNKVKTKIQVLYRLSGSNQILLTKNVRETLVGRAQYFYLNTLSVSEIKKSFPKITVGEIIFNGGLPEIYTNKNLSVVQFLNSYINNYVQKDIAFSAGIEKLREFDIVLGLIAARVGQIINYADIAKDSGVKSVTVKEWIGVLEKSQLVYVLQPYFSNLNKRLIKSPKIYFWDSGLAVRLQGWSELGPMLKSPSIGSLFENLVLGEIIKFKQNHGKDWPLFFWRTIDQEEVDFILEINQSTHLAFEVKWGLNAGSVEIPKKLSVDFPNIKEIILIVPDGPEVILSKSCRQISISALGVLLKKY